MIYVWDNGLELQDHCILFYESSLSKKDVLPFLNCVSSHEDGVTLAIIYSMDNMALEVDPLWVQVVLRAVDREASITDKLLYYALANLIIHGLRKRAVQVRMFKALVEKRLKEPHTDAQMRDLAEEVLATADKGVAGVLLDYVVG